MADVADVRHDISLVLQERALQELAAPLAVLRRRVYDEFKRKRSSATLNGILRTRGVTIIKNVRQNATGAISSGRLKARLCAAVDVYLPLYYVLVDTKNEDTYWRMLE
ncbi:hypothetical protein PF001_g13031 [Phytophthora fragariae]|uniref:Uncharacterized protein n=1 Tax=Phytophthora fragariae TaxID=53985 RepID=A0A6A3TV71_9STRA|nr:hypothetical protein PF006_g12689 [Phytophthora fragariae]KAE9304513.1 hypothetical protein PF001_g13031 [Phytophthora fragariae]